MPIIVVDNETFPWVDVRPGVKRRVISDPSLAPGIGLVQLGCEPGAGAPDHTHPYDETYTVLEGRFEIWSGTQRLVLEPASTAFVPEAVVHGFQAIDGPGLIQGTIPSAELISVFPLSEGPVRVLAG